MNKKAIITYDNNEHMWRADLWFNETDHAPVIIMRKRYIDLCHEVKEFLEE